MTDPIVSATSSASPSAASGTPAKSTDPSKADAAQAQGFASIVLMQLAQVLHIISPNGAAQGSAAKADAVSADSGKSLPLTALLQGAAGAAGAGQAGDAAHGTATGGGKDSGKADGTPGDLTLTVFQDSAQDAQGDAKLLQAIFSAAGGNSGGKEQLLQQLQHAGLLKGLPDASAHAGAQDSANAVSTLGQAPAAARTVAAAPAQAPVSVPVPVQHQGWSEALASRVAWQIGQNIQHAEIHLNPPNLGPLDVKISLQHDQASVQFATHHLLVRDALHDAIPKLREMLSQQGLNLADANVSHQSPNQGGHQQPSHQPGSEAADFALSGDFFPAGESVTSTGSGTLTALGLIDYYA